MSAEAGWSSCPKCDAAVVMGEARCWLCDEVLPRGGVVATAGAAQPQWTGSSSVLAILVPILVWGAVTALAPGVGFLLLLVATPALLAIAMDRHHESNRRMKSAHGNKLGALLSSLFFVFVAMMLALVMACTAVVVAGFLVCGVLGISGQESSETAFFLPLGIGGAVVIVASYVIGKKISRHLSRRELSGRLRQRRERS